MTTTLLEIKDLNITFDFNNQTVKAVKKSNFKILKGECLAIVGESGSGKSVTALSIMKLIRSNSQLKISGDVIYEKKNFLFSGIDCNVFNPVFLKTSSLFTLGSTIVILKFLDFISSIRLINWEFLMSPQLDL